MEFRDDSSPDAERAVIPFRRAPPSVLILTDAADLPDDQASPWRVQFNGGRFEIRRWRRNLGGDRDVKRGFREAIQDRFDYVVALQDNRSISPAVVWALLKPLIDGDADAVIEVLPSSFKPAVHRLLAWFQEILVGKRLGGHDSGRRAYLVAALSQLPLNANSSDDSIHDEVMLQLVAGRFRINEAAMASSVAEEPRLSHGIGPAWKALKTAAAYRLHKAGLLYDRRFDLKRGRQYTFKRNRFSSHRRIAAMAGAPVAGPSSQLLDVGCGGGFLAASLAQQGFEVCGVDAYDSPEARRYCREFIVADVENDDWLHERPAAETIVFADVLEHLRDPEKMLLRMRRRLNSGGRIIASTGNVAHAFIRLSLLFGVFRYTERGILDRTHVRLFTTRSFRRLFVECGFRITKVRYCPIPFENVFPRWRRFADLLSALNMAFVWLWPSLFAYQTVVEARPSGAPAEWLTAEEFAGESDDETDVKMAA